MPSRTAPDRRSSPSPRVSAVRCDVLRGFRRALRLGALAIVDIAVMAVALAGFAAFYA